MFLWVGLSGKDFISHWFQTIKIQSQDTDFGVSIYNTNQIFFLIIISLFGDQGFDGFSSMWGEADKTPSFFCFFKTQNSFHTQKFLQISFLWKWLRPQSCKLCWHFTESLQKGNFCVTAVKLCQVACNPYQKINTKEQGLHSSV